MATHTDMLAAPADPLRMRAADPRRRRESGGGGLSISGQAVTSETVVGAMVAQGLIRAEDAGSALAIVRQLLPERLTVDQPAARMNCGRDTITRACKSGRLPADDVGHKGEHSFRIKPDDLERAFRHTPQVISPSARRPRRRASTYKPQVLTGRER